MKKYVNWGERYPVYYISDVSHLLGGGIEVTDENVIKEWEEISERWYKLQDKLEEIASEANNN